MTVRELIKKLQYLDDNIDVVLQEDPTNSDGCVNISISYGQILVDDCIYDTTWTAKEACMKNNEWEKFKKNQKKCVVICPIH